MKEFVTTHVRDGVATMLLSRPPANALSRQVLREITATVAEVNADPEVRAVILFGGHEVFCTGEDVAEWGLLDAAGRDGFTAAVDGAVAAVAALAVPTVAAVTGYALAAGLTLALAADWRIGGDNARVGATGILDGLAPSAPAAARLAAAVGPGQARDLVFSGRFVAATPARQLGLLDELAAPDHVYDAALNWVRRLDDRPPATLQAAKAAFAGGAHRPAIGPPPSR